MEHDIGVRSSTETVDARIARLAATQHGVFSRAQAVAEGAARSFIQHRLAARRWELRHPGIYAVAGTPAAWRQQLMAACLAAGDGARASHRAAGAVWRLPGGSEEIMELSVPKERRVRLRGVLVHRAAGLIPADVTVVDAIPVTTATRTLIDLAAMIPGDTLEEALDDALRRRLTSVPRLRWRLNGLGRRGRPGTGTLRALLEARTGGEAVPESVIETRLLRVLREAGLPAPVCQYEIRDRGRVLARVDAAYPEIRLAIEVDGYRWHSGRARWERDLARRNALTARGWRIIHVTWSDLENRPDRIARTIADAVAGR
jgi:hypothetical protein